MPSEKEAKFKVRSHAAVRRALKAAGAAYLGTVLQTDRYFDLPDASLRRGDRGLRIRTVRRLRPTAGRRVGTEGGEDPRPLVTLKGPRRPGKIKIRTEVQTHVDNPGALVEAFRACGLAVSMTIQKRRASYLLEGRFGRCRVELDELPLLGSFVEVEGGGEKAIRDACRRLGLAGESITVPYTFLVADYCRRRGISPSRVRFRTGARRGR